MNLREQTSQHTTFGDLKLKQANSKQFYLALPHLQVIQGKVSQKKRLLSIALR